MTTDWERSVEESLKILDITSWYYMKCIMYRCKIFNLIRQKTVYMRNIFLWLTYMLYKMFKQTMFFNSKYFAKIFGRTQIIKLSCISCNVCQNVFILVADLYLFLYLITLHKNKRHMQYTCLPQRYNFVDNFPTFHNTFIL